METLMNTYFESKNLSEKEQQEILELFNKCLICVGEGILRECKSNKIDKSKKINEDKKFASKKAEEYAKENGLTIDNFTGQKISKMDVDKKIREIALENKSVASTPRKESTKKVTCNGMTKKGDSCTRAGTHQPNGAKYRYCFKHADEFRAFECSSDSDSEESEEEKEVEVDSEEEKEIQVQE